MLIVSWVFFVVAMFKCHIFELLPLCESRRLHNLEFFQLWKLWNLTVKTVLTHDTACIISYVILLLLVPEVLVHLHWLPVPPRDTAWSTRSPQQWQPWLFVMYLWSCPLSNRCTINYWYDMWYVVANLWSHCCSDVTFVANTFHALLLCLIIV